MSAETSEWLNTNTLIGFTDRRGTAWHYRAEDQGTESNHYPGAIPVADVERRLFYWKPTLADMLMISYVDMHGNIVTVEDKGHVAVVHPEDGYVFGIHGKDYKIHDFNEWLLTLMSNILGTDLYIGSAGLLRDGAQAWVQCEMDETVFMDKEGIAFRPWITGFTSLDATLPTGFTRGIQEVVCDNTLSANMRSSKSRIHYKHTKNSEGRIMEAREALEVVYATTEDAQKQLTALCQVDVSDKQWQSFLNMHIPFPEENGRGMTMAENKRADFRRLWNSDERVSPWKNTAFGVVQCVNTWTHHFSIVRNADRGERNMQRAISGGVDKLDNATISQLEKVMDRELLTV